MTSLFRAPKVNIPKAPEPIPTPSIDTAQANKTESDRIRRRRGAAGNQLTGPMGAIVPASSLGTKQLTGM
jgi:hypothetical protein